MLALNSGLYGIQGRLSSITRDAYRFAISNKVAQSAVSKINSLRSFLSPATQTHAQKDLGAVLLEGCEKMRKQVERMSCPCHGDDLRPCHRNYLSRVKEKLGEIEAHVEGANGNASALNKCQDKLNELTENLKAYKSLSKKICLADVIQFLNFTVLFLLPLLACFILLIAGVTTLPPVVGAVMLLTPFSPAVCFPMAAYIDCERRDLTGAQDVLASKEITLN